MSKLLLPVGFPNTNLAGTEIKGKNIDPIDGSVVAPNSSSFPTKSALTTAINASLAAGKGAFGLSR